MAYSFQDVTAYILGLGGSVNLGADSGSSEEGITVTMNEDKNTMTIGADGSGMHSLHAGRAGVVTIRLLKTSAVNGLLSDMYNIQSINSAGWGKNVITIRNNASGDAITCSLAAFKRWPNLAYAKDGGMNEWTFDSIRVDGFLGKNG